MSLKNACGTLIMALVVLATAGVARAQDGRGIRLYEEQLRVRMDQQQSSARQEGFDAGGWFSFAFFHFDDAAAEKERVLRQYELRLWGSYTLHGVHTFYVRGRTGLDDWNSGTNPQHEGGDQFNDPRVERAWYRFDFDRMMRNQTGQTPQSGFNVTVGREYFEIGSALVLALPLDAVAINTHFGDWKLMALLGKTVTDTPNIDTSAPVDDHMQRCFWGAELRYAGFDRHEPYIYWLSQKDHTRPGPNPTNQGFSYDSSYLGAGSRGSVLLPNLRYGTEFVFETGKTFGDGAQHVQDDIHAFAFDAMLEYMFDVQRHPKVFFEYLWGSGDSDRRTTATSTIGGNRPGTQDNAFNAFGFRDTGLAFAPKIANLHIYELGASFFPWEDTKLFRKLEVGTKTYFYHKQMNGPISDPTADNDGRWVGWEWDVFANWRITSDLSWTVRYGNFFPGSVFDSQDCRKFLYSGVSYSF